KRARAGGGVRDEDYVQIRISPGVRPRTPASERFAETAPCADSIRFLKANPHSTICCSATGVNPRCRIAYIGPCLRRWRNTSPSSTQGPRSSNWVLQAARSRHYCASVLRNCEPRSLVRGSNLLEYGFACKPAWHANPSQIRLRNN